MDGKPTSLTNAVRTLAAADRSEREEALPAPEDLVAYRAGELGKEAEEALQRHLSLHPESAREYLDLASFPQLEAPGEELRLSDREVGEALARMRARIQEEEEEGPPAAGKEPPQAADAAAVIHPFPEERRHTRRRRGWTLLLAAMALPVLGAFWIGTLYGTASEPRYAAVIDLDTTRGARPFAVSRHAEQILLIVHGVDLGTYPRGQLEIATDSGEVLRSHEIGAAPDEESLLYLALPRDVLADGNYRIRLFGDDGGRRRLLKEYRLTLEVP